MTERERRAALPPCDLVMKGGITSGVVYPGAVLDLAEHRRFESVGGASAGAIAAAVTAAAEFGARRSAPGGGFAALQRVVDDLGRDGFLEGLFQATPPTRPLLDALLRGLREGRSARGRAIDVAGAVLGRRRWVPPALALAALAGLAAAVVLARALPLAAALAVLPILVVVIAAAAGLIALRVARRAGARLHDALRESGFGMCPGTQQPGYAGPALTEWLHERIQDAAGLPLDEPLTFAMLETEGVRLEVMTTDLSYARPLRLPFETDEYFFRAGDVRALFPAPVVEALIGEQGPLLERTPGAALRFPRADLPVLVAARMSLSFPLLLSAVRLLTLDPTRMGAAEPGVEPYAENWFSDGGIASNFPIHFFDSWLPSHPTFGLDLQTAAMTPDSEPVRLHGRVDRMPPPRWGEIAGLGGFAGAIKDVMQNWRDNTQAALPGYRDRVCTVHLQPSEGGLNLNMKGATIAELVERGRAAGRTLRSDFDWSAHRWARYLTLMQLMEVNLRDVGPKFAPYGERLAAAGPGTGAYARGHDGDWCARAAAATAELLAVAERWGVDPPPALGFNRGGGIEPEPVPAMRITPRV